MPGLSAVDYLSDNHFPVRHTAIVGRGPSSVEQVTGRLTAWRAAGQSSMLLGALFGWLFGLVGWIAYLLLALYGAIFGAVVGGLIGLASHALTGGRRDFASIRGMTQWWNPCSPPKRYGCCRHRGRLAEGSFELGRPVATSLFHAPGGGSGAVPNPVEPVAGEVVQHLVGCEQGARGG